MALRRVELGAVLVASDFGAAVAAAVAAPILWTLVDREFAPTTGLPYGQLLFPLLWVALLRIVGAADFVSPRFGRRSITAVFEAYLGSTALVMAVFFLAPFFIPRGSSLLTPAVAAATSLVARFLFLHLLAPNVTSRRAVVLGADEAARRTISAMTTSTTTPVAVLCVYDTNADRARTSTMPATHLVLPFPPDFWSAVSELGADLVVVGHTSNVPQRVLAELVQCYEHGVEAIPATVLYEQLTGRVLVSALEADWYADLPTGPAGGYGLVKRASDIVLAAVGLVILSPLMLLVAGAIVADSGGPVLIRQRRVGKQGSEFVLYKFRSMRPDAEADGEPVWAAPNDPRRTRVGRLLRQYRLDELPQLWNIFLGHMSIVGPRPERPEFVARLGAQLPLYRARLLVRPGLTGWAQVLYPYAGSVEENLAKLEYDLYYIRHLGAALDVSILFRTVSIVLGLSRPEFAKSSPTNP